MTDARSVLEIVTGKVYGIHTPIFVGDGLEAKPIITKVYRKSSAQARECESQYLTCKPTNNNNRLNLARRTSYNFWGNVIYLFSDCERPTNQCDYRTTYALQIGSACRPRKEFFRMQTEEAGHRGNHWDEF